MNVPVVSSFVFLYMIISFIGPTLSNGQAARFIVSSLLDIATGTATKTSESRYLCLALSTSSVMLSHLLCGIQLYTYIHIPGIVYE